MYSEGLVGALGRWREAYGDSNRIHRFPIMEGGLQDESCIFKRLWSPRIDSKELIPPAHAARRAGTITLFLLGS